MKGALDYLFVYTLGKRTFGNPSDYPEVYAASLDASVLSVVRMYVQQVAYDLKPVFRSSLGLFKVRYDVVFIMFILATAPVVMAARSYRFRFLEGIRRRRPILALAAALWFSSLAPLSWLVVFKGHSYLHAHMNSIVWQMPFTFLGFALWGAVISAMRDRGD